MLVFCSVYLAYNRQLHCTYMCCIKNRKCTVYVVGPLNSWNLQMWTRFQASKFLEIFLKKDSKSNCQAHKVLPNNCKWIVWGFFGSFWGELWVQRKLFYGLITKQDILYCWWIKINETGSPRVIHTGMNVH